MFFTNGTQCAGAQLFFGEFWTLFARHALTGVAIALRRRAIAVLLAWATWAFAISRFVLATFAITGCTTLGATFAGLPLTLFTITGCTTLGATFAGLPVTLLPVATLTITRGAAVAITLRASTFARLALSRATISSWRAGSTSARTV
jgi:hypothetical protein